MHALVGVQLGDHRQELRLGGRGGKAAGDGLHADLFGLLALAADIDLAGGVFAHQHHGQAWLQAVAGRQMLDLRRDARAQAFRKRLAVDDPRVAHGPILVEETCLMARRLQVQAARFRRSP